MGSEMCIRDSNRQNRVTQAVLDADVILLLLGEKYLRSEDGAGQREIGAINFRLQSTQPSSKGENLLVFPVFLESVPDDFIPDEIRSLQWVCSPSEPFTYLDSERQDEVARNIAIQIADMLSADGGYPVA